MTVLIDLIAGARPNFMKIAPIIRAMESRKSQGGALRYRLVHTGQHYDARMSGDFFEQLGIPEPNINLAALNPYPLALPPLSEQQEIVRRVEGLFALADELEERLAKARGQVEKLTPSLRARTFAGKLVP